MAYDVPVKLFSFHLILMSVFLLAPDASRLLKVFLGQAAGPSTQFTPGRTLRARRFIFGTQIVAGFLFVMMTVTSSLTSWYVYGGGAKKTQLYGIWNVDEMLIDGQTRSPLLTDYDRWRRVIIDSFSPTAANVNFQRMDDAFVTYAAKIDATSITLTKPADPRWKATFALQKPADTQLVLSGDMDGRSVGLHLRLVDRNSFPLVNRGFHWAQDRPFNR
jgi:hypothetical protein